MWREVLFGAAFLVATVGVSAELAARDRGYYADSARELGLDRVTFHFADGDRRVGLERVLLADESVRAYVLGERDAFDAQGFFDDGERAHLADVRRVFSGVHLVSVCAALAALTLGARLRPRRVRRAALVGAGLVLLLGAAAALAFEPLFLAFHAVFFPQGNFLFDPSRQNLVLLYAEPYWLGVTERIGVTAVAAALVVAALTTVQIRSATNR